MNKLHIEDIEKLSNSVSVLDYFFHLDRRNIVEYDRKRGRDHYFLTPNNKFSVTDEAFHDFKTGEGGKIIKAVMMFENKSWREAVDFLKDFSNTYVPDKIAERKIKESNSTSNNNNVKITKIVTPNNEKLIEYFQERGISKEILQTYAKQIHYENNGKNYFGIGLQNLSQGYEIRNPMMKTKIGKNDMTIINQNNGKNVIVFEGMTDMLSFLQLQKLNGKENHSTLVVLNSVVNTDKFIEHFKDYKNNIYLCLDGDAEGTKATNKIFENIHNADIFDIRSKYGISENGFNDLNNFLQNRKDIQKKITNLAEGFKATEKATGTEYTIKSFTNTKEKISLNIVEIPKDITSFYVTRVKFGDFKNLRGLFERYSFQDLQGNDLTLFNDNTIIIQEKNSQNEQKSIEPTGISTPITMGGRPLEQNIGGNDQTSQSEQKGDNGSRQTMDGNNVGNGFSTSEQFVLHQQGGLDRGHHQSVGNQSTSENRTSDYRTIGTDERGGVEGEIRELGENQLGGNEEKTTSNRLTNLLEKYNGEKVSNEQITEIVNALTSVSADQKIQINEGVEISDEVKNIISQYKTGGIAKEGRGVLDEYYTDEKLVNAVRNLIKDNFNGQKEIQVLEPSVGTGNFLSAVKDLGIKTQINSFEINETTAKITKLLHPNVEVNLRSFETEFIDDKGNKKSFEPKYDLIIGNPPYGQHRGLYKGLGEETKLSRYEDYFVKRSLDVLKEGGTLAMVLPSGWLNRQNKLTNAELINAFRLPTGAFKGTEVGTDIIILKKNSQAKIQNISNYFSENPNKILGEHAQKTNRFGKLEDYVKGSLDDALVLLDKIKQVPTKEVKEELKEGQQLNLFDVQEDIAEEKTISEAVQRAENQEEINLVKDKINLTLEIFNAVKFKSTSTIKDIQNYEIWKQKITQTPEKFSAEELKNISEKSDKIIQLLQTKNDKEYKIQTTPEIKKGILKYQFSKQDEIVETGLQNSPNLTEEQVKSFRDTYYTGNIYDFQNNKKYANCYRGNWVHDFYYAEGNIYEKLEILERDKDNISQEQYEKQKALLESVLPPKKALEDIVISPNHEFVHKFSVGEEEREILKHTGYNYGGRRATPIYERAKEMVNVSLADKFQRFVNSLPSEAFGNSSSWEVNSFVRNETVTGSDRERNALVRERRKEVANDLFKKFIHEELSDELKEKFVNEFNRKYNNIHIPDYTQFPLFSKIHQNFKGKPLQLTEVQKAGIGRLTTKGVGLLAHEVGFGKTLSGILSMHEAMERGNAKRPLIVVPNDSILKQWVETIFETIPNAKVNVLGNLGASYDLSKFDNKDGEITLVTYEGFNNIGFSKETTERLAKHFSYISENELKTLKHTEREIQIELQKKEEIQGKMKKGKIYDWEDFGFDHLTFDEVHNANHIVGKVKIEDRRFASDFRNQNQRTSQLGMNTWMASQYIQDKHNGRNITLLSATPFTNKPLEYYSILSLIANDRLEKSGYFNVNNFFETFMEADTEMEIDAKGDIKNKTNVRRFKNNDLFQQLLSEFIDIKGEEDNPELKRPNRINKEYKIEQNELTKELYENLNSSLDESKDGAILTHILNARKIAFSPYLSSDYIGKVPTTKEFIENSPKLKTTMDLIAQNKKDKPEAGQIIYSELGVSEFPKLKEYLINEVGYKADEVGIITGATTDKQRRKIQEDFNNGKIKIVIGSEAIQEGMNLQENTTDMYLLTLPYNFTSLRQTEGRAWRQGNKWENVRINFMLTNDSIDVFMLQKLQAKQNRYMEAIKKGASVVDVSDVDTQELKTAIITDPYTRAEIEIKLLEKKYEAEKTRHNADLGFVSRKFEAYLESDEYRTSKRLKNEFEYSKRFVNEESNADGYWTKNIQQIKEKMVVAEENLQKLAQKLKEKGVDVENFQKQKQQTEAKIEELDKKIKEELPILKQNLITQYKQEKEERQKRTSQFDFVQERAEENKSFFKLAPTKEEKVTEKENIQQEIRQKSSFRR